MSSFIKMENFEYDQSWNVWVNYGHVEEVWRAILGIITSLYMVVQSHFFIPSPNQVLSLLCWTKIMISSYYINLVL